MSPGLFRDRRPPYILVDCCNYFGDNDNLGDRAVYQVIARRLTELWPGAQISWITLDPKITRDTCRSARPFVLTERHHWQLFDPLGTGDRLSMPPEIHWAFPRLLAARLRKKVPRRLLRAPPDVPFFLEAFRRAALVLAVGGGAFSDAFAEHSCGLLDTLEGGIAFGKPTALMSCGFEPVTNQRLLAKARSVLPRLSLVACRERRAGPRLLEAFGVDPGRFMVTGDEGVELGYEMRSDRLGGGIGISLRCSDYSGLETRHVEAIAAGVRSAVGEHGAPLIPLPISRYGPSDMDVIREVLNACDQGGQEGLPADNPQSLITRVSACRVVVAGSYHAAVFALSQGVPVVGLAGSLHYRVKLGGLSEQFGAGCRVLEADAADLSAALPRAIHEMWSSAEFLRPSLLEEARRQVDASRDAYRRLRACVAA